MFICFKKLRIFNQLVVKLLFISLILTSFGYYLTTVSNSYANIVDIPLNQAINKFKPVLGKQPQDLPRLKGLTFPVNNPLNISFYLDNRNKKAVETKALKHLINYFLGALTIPQEKLWVNLSPYESHRIIPEVLDRTDIGKNLLFTDFNLKRLSSYLIRPDIKQSQRFWQQVIKITKAKNIPIDSLYKIWIVPEKALVYEYKHYQNSQEWITVCIKEAKLRVMLEDDYLAIQGNHLAKNDYIFCKKNKYKKEYYREIKEIFKKEVLPIIDKEVNEGISFAPLRQLVTSVILANYFKSKVREHNIYLHYIDKEKISRLQLGEVNCKDIVYQAYLKQFNSQQYKENKYDKYSGKAVTRKYFLGGIKPAAQAQLSQAKSLLTIEEILQDTHKISGQLTGDKLNKLDGTETMLIKRMEDKEVSIWDKIRDNIYYLGQISNVYLTNIKEAFLEKIKNIIIWLRVRILLLTGAQALQSKASRLQAKNKYEEAMLCYVVLARYYMLKKDYYRAVEANIGAGQFFVIQVAGISNNYKQQKDKTTSNVNRAVMSLYKQAINAFKMVAVSCQRIQEEELSKKVKNINFSRITRDRIYSQVIAELKLVGTIRTREVQREVVKAIGEVFTILKEEENQGRDVRESIEEIKKSLIDILVHRDEQIRNLAQGILRKFSDFWILFAKGCVKALDNPSSCKLAVTMLAKNKNLFPPKTQEEIKIKFKNIISKTKAQLNDLTGAESLTIIAKALELKEFKDWQEALEIYTQVGDFYSQQRRDKEAREVFLRGVNLSGKVIAQYRQQAVLTAKQGEVFKQLQRYREINRFMKDRAHKSLALEQTVLLLKQAHSNEKERSYQVAAAYYEQIGKIYQELAGTYKEEREVFLNKAVNRYGQAVRLCKRLNNLTNLAILYEILADIYNKKADYHSAEVLYKESLNTKNHNPILREKLARVLLVLGKQQEAAQQYKARGDILFEQARELLNAKDLNQEKIINLYQEAQVAYENVESLRFYQADIYYNLGVISNYLGDKAQAFLQWQKGFRVYSKFSELAKAQESLLKIEELCKDLGRREEVSTMWQKLGVNYMKLADYERAEFSLMQALKLREDDPFTYRLLGKVYKLSNKHKLASIYYWQAAGLYRKFRLENEAKSMEILYKQEHIKFLNFQVVLNKRRIEKLTKDSDYTGLAQAHYRIGEICLFLAKDAADIIERKKYILLACKAFDSAAVHLKIFYNTNRNRKIINKIVGVYLKIADTLEEIKDYPHLVKIYKEILEYSQKNTEVYRKLIAVYIALQDYENVAKQYKILGLLFMAEKDYPKAQESFQKALLNNHDDQYTLKLLADTYEINGKHMNALECYLKAINIQLSNSATIDSKEVIFFSLELLIKARKSFNFFRSSLSAQDKVKNEQRVVALQNKIAQKCKLLLREGFKKANDFIKQNRLDEALEVYNRMVNFLQELIKKTSKKRQFFYYLNRYLMQVYSSLCSLSSQVCLAEGAISKISKEGEDLINTLRYSDDLSDEAINKNTKAIAKFYFNLAGAYDRLKNNKPENQSKAFYYYAMAVFADNKVLKFTPWAFKRVYRFILLIKQNNMWEYLKDLGLNIYLSLVLPREEAKAISIDICTKLAQLYQENNSREGARIIKFLDNMNLITYEGLYILARSYSFKEGIRILLKEDKFKTVRLYYWIDFLFKEKISEKDMPSILIATSDQEKSLYKFLNEFIRLSNESNKNSLEANNRLKEVIKALNNIDLISIFNNDLQKNIKNKKSVKEHLEWIRKIDLLKLLQSDYQHDKITSWIKAKPILLYAMVINILENWNGLDNRTNKLFKEIINTFISDDNYPFLWSLYQGLKNNPKGNVILYKDSETFSLSLVKNILGQLESDLDKEFKKYYEYLVIDLVQRLSVDNNKDFELLDKLNLERIYKTASYDLGVIKILNLRCAQEEEELKKWREIWIEYLLFNKYNDKDFSAIFSETVNLMWTKEKDYLLKIYRSIKKLDLSQVVIRELYLEISDSGRFYPLSVIKDLYRILNDALKKDKSFLSQDNNKASQEEIEELYNNLKKETNSEKREEVIDKIIMSESFVQWLKYLAQQFDKDKFSQEILKDTIFYFSQQIEKEQFISVKNQKDLKNIANICRNYLGLRSIVQRQLGALISGIRMQGVDQNGKYFIFEKLYYLAYCDFLFDSIMSLLIKLDRQGIKDSLKEWFCFLLTQAQEQNDNHFSEILTITISNILKCNNQLADYFLKLHRQLFLLMPVISQQNKAEQDLYKNCILAYKGGVSGKHIPNLVIFKDSYKKLIDKTILDRINILSRSTLLIIDKIIAKKLKEFDVNSRLTGLDNIDRRSFGYLEKIGKDLKGGVGLDSLTVKIENLNVVYDTLFSQENISFGQEMNDPIPEGLSFFIDSIKPKEKNVF